MSRQSRGLQKENEIAKEIYETTGGTVIPVRAGYSGNAAVPLPDLLIPVAGSLRAIELKTSSQDRFSVNPEDVEQVVNWSMDMTEIPTYPYLSVKFSNYEVYTGRMAFPWDIERSFEAWAEDTPFRANVTKSGNLSVHHPTKMSRSERDEKGVTSAQKSPGDGVAMIRDLRQDEYANTSADEIQTVGVYEVIRENPEYLSNL
jgi:Holliday junction resolvase - archaeal type